MAKLTRILIEVVKPMLSLARTLHVHFVLILPGEKNSCLSGHILKLKEGEAISSRVSFMFRKTRNTDIPIAASQQRSDTCRLICIALRSFNFSLLKEKLAEALVFGALHTALGVRERPARLLCAGIAAVERDVTTIVVGVPRSPAAIL